MYSKIQNNKGMFLYQTKKLPSKKQKPQQEWKNKNKKQKEPPPTTQ
jgi:hypothetical protein